MKKETIDKNLGVSVSGAELENRVSEISDEVMNGVVGGFTSYSDAFSNPTPSQVWEKGTSRTSTQWQDVQSGYSPFAKKATD